VLRGKVSVVTVFSSVWGEAQVNTFTGIEQNPELQEILDNNKAMAQRVDINIEENAIKAWIVVCFSTGCGDRKRRRIGGNILLFTEGLASLFGRLLGC